MTYTNMRHADLRRHVLAWCEWYRCAVMEIPPRPRGTTANGWPDLVIVGRRGILYRELKTPYDRLAAQQYRWGWRLRGAGADWAIWQPIDLMAGRIKAQLEAISLGDDPRELAEQEAA